MSLNIRTYRTAKDTGERLALGGSLSNGVASIELRVDAARRFQTIRGFGGAFTEAGGWVLSQLPLLLRDRILTSYFHPEMGLGYTVCRSHVNSCDFSLGNYSCCDIPGDTELAAFSVERDEKWLLPFIRGALSVPRARFELMVTPWSPPAWMKTNARMNGGGKLRPEYRGVWARFLARFIREYRGRGVPVKLVSVQNEPEAAQTWDSCIWTAEEEGQFVAEHLGPALEQAGLGDVDILVWDHNRDAMVRRASGAMGCPGAPRYIHGTAFHWYSGEQFENVSRVHELFPDKHLYFTEGCVERLPRPGGWRQGERYAHHIINDLNHWCEAWIDWNMILSVDGGPNHAGNYCEAPVLVDIEREEVIHLSSYWYLGHFSRFIRPGSWRIAHDVCGNIPAIPGGGAGVEASAFSATGRDAIVVVLNRTEKHFGLRISAFGETEGAGLPPRSISTFLIEKNGPLVRG